MCLRTFLYTLLLVSFTCASRSNDSYNLQKYEDSKKAVQAEEMICRQLQSTFDRKNQELKDAERAVERFENELRQAQNTYRSLNAPETSTAKQMLKKNVDQAENSLKTAKHNKAGKQRSYNLAERELQKAKVDLQNAKQKANGMVCNFRC